MVSRMVEQDWVQLPRSTEEKRSEDEALVKAIKKIKQRKRQRFSSDGGEEIEIQMWKHNQNHIIHTPTTHPPSCPF
jgi:hypothetical protein